MIDFKKIDEYIDIIENNRIPEGMDFNNLALDFFKVTQTLPLSKYLRKIDRTNRMPKIMNMKKAGEVLYYSEKDEDVKSFLSRKGYKEMPQFNYRSILLLRKVEPLDNWMKVLQFYEGKGSLQEISDSLKPKLLPLEVEKLENHVKDELRVDDKELNWILKLFGKVQKDKQLQKSLKKLLDN
ncbi:MAG: hypothetical protein ACRCTS_08180 [Fusobacteriaceae bacterium]